MAGSVEWVKRPASKNRYREPTTVLNTGYVLALVGVTAVLVASIGNFVAASDLSTDPAGAASTKQWTFGLNTAGVGTVKIGIAVILAGILMRLWHRVDSVKEALPALQDPDRQRRTVGPFKSEFGAGKATAEPPKPLAIHTVAKALWLPMLVMGAMALVAGLIVSFVAADSSGASLREASAWSQGLTFLGEAFLLSGISFLLGTILAGLREGGGEVQASLGVNVRTLNMPASAKAFIALMALGMMMGILQFILYIAVAGFAENAASFASWAAWLGPFREASIGVLLSGIVLALYTISKVLGFQFARIRNLMTAAA